ncbi:MAG: protein kinase [Gemmatimonadales bacterium]
MSTRACPNCGNPLPSDAAYCDQCGSAGHTQVIGGTEQTEAALASSYVNQPERLQRALGDQFELGSLIGRGGYAEVYAVRDRKLKRELAVKVLRPDLIVTPALLARFRREALSVAALQHPAIVPVFDVGERDGICYIVMPLIRGESLKALLQRQRRIPLDEVQRVVGEAASALAVAHEAGVVHRDIKPENILLEGREGHVRIMDFGIAKAVDSSEKELTGTGVVVGTPQYMSPEQASGEPNIDPRSDQYSLAVVAYQMVAGRAPFDGETARAIIAKQLLDLPPVLDPVADRVPPNVVAALHRAMQKQPANRFANIQEFAAALRDPDYRNPPGLGADSTKAAAGRRWTPWLLAGAAAGVVGVIGYTQFVRPDLDPAPPPATIGAPGNGGGNLGAPTSPAAPTTPAGTTASTPSGSNPTAVVPPPAPPRPDTGSRPAANPTSTAPTTPDTGTGLLPEPPAPTPSCAVLVDQQDWTRARQQCQAEGQAGNPAALRIAAEILLAGRGPVPRDEAQAAQLYEQAAAAGDAEAQFWMGNRLGNRAPTDATNWFLAAARQGLAKAFPRVAERLDRGVGTAVDRPAAFRWYERAANGGDVASQRRVAEMYGAGVGVGKDEGAARRWYARAADPAGGNDPESQYQLAQMFFRGRGGPKSEAEGLAWLRRAAAGGHAEAARELARRTDA